MTSLLDSFTIEELVTDTTTGLIAGPAARRIFARRIADTSHLTTLVTVVDLDDLKATNDTHGHEAGDRLLAKAGDIIRRGIRSQWDAYRFGGDEFVILHNAPVWAAESIEGRLRYAFNGHREVRASVGTAETYAAADARMLLAKAAKKAGNRWQVA